MLSRLIKKVKSGLIHNRQWFWKRAACYKNRGKRFILLVIWVICVAVAISLILVVDAVAGLVKIRVEVVKS